MIFTRQLEILVTALSYFLNNRGLLKDITYNIIQNNLGLLTTPVQGHFVTVLAALEGSTFSTSLAAFWRFNRITILTVIFGGGFGCCIFNYIHPPLNNKQTLKRINNISLVGRQLQTRRGLEPKRVPQLFLDSNLRTHRSAIG